MSVGRPDLTPREQRHSDPARVLAFTDGVFAIIITILVLELHVPNLDEGQRLGDALTEIRPTFVAFVLSFVLVGMYWWWHRAFFADVRYVNNDVVWLNLLFLLPTAMVPFAASVLGEYEGNASAIRLYGSVLMAVTLARVALDRYLRSHPGLLFQASSRQARRMSTVVEAMPLLVYGVGMLVAGALPWLSIALYLSVPLVYLAAVALLKADPRTKVAAEDLS